MSQLLLPALMVILIVSGLVFWWRVSASETVGAFNSTWAFNSTGAFMKYSDAHYESCLAGKRIVFIGDSRVRYQFMALAHFLTLGFRNDCESGSDRFLKTNCHVVAKDHIGMSWKTWYNLSTQLLSQNGSKFLCDCFRNPADIGQTRENRYFERKTRFGDISLTYFQSFTEHLSFRNQFPPYNAPGIQCEPGLCEESDHKKDFFQTINEVVPAMKPTHLFANTGWAEKDIGCFLTDFGRRHNINVTEISHLCERHEIIPRLVNQSCGLRIFDRKNRTCGRGSRLYFDGLHALSTLNNELNDQLIDELCPFSP